MNDTHWTRARIPDQEGRTAVVTGANSGLGYETTKALSANGAHVVMACRSMERAREAESRIERDVPGASLSVLEIDLADLASVEAFAEGFESEYDRLDLLVNNAGVMMPPFSRTDDGFELQIGVSFFGHFALTGHLVDTLRATPDSRVVTLSSLAANFARIDFDNLRGEKPYRKLREYGQSKLAALVFALELQRRLDRAGSDTASLAAHPGFTTSNLQRHLGALNYLVQPICMPTERGALPILYAGTAPDAEPGGYYGPDGVLEIRGYPGPAKVPSRARDETTARRLWETAEELTGVRFLSDGGREGVDDTNDTGDTDDTDGTGDINDTDDSARAEP
jgi:NAD(P)-dependent dehydrogenase (short-subunit alcohol dehydrogenase family)